MPTEQKDGHSKNATKTDTKNKYSIIPCTWTIHKYTYNLQKLNTVIKREEINTEKQRTYFGQSLTVAIRVFAYNVLGRLLHHLLDKA